MTMTEIQHQLMKDCSTPGCGGLIPFESLDKKRCDICESSDQ